MAAFQWNTNFITGISSVDAEHEHLVALINRLGDMLGSNELKLGDLGSLLEELVAYAIHHFSDEEALMRRAELDPRHVDAHRMAHAGFLQEVRLLQKDVGTDDRQAARRLLDYLTHWLAFHILVKDQNMARQLRSIAVGATPREAFEAEEETSDTATEPLVTALSGLFDQVSERNLQLVQLNKMLEARVEARTRDLIEANHKLETLSLTDALTEMPNRRHAMMVLGSSWEESSADGQPLSCMVLDLDYFKQVNDTHGHEAGDMVLIEVSRTIRHTLRTDDFAFRLGGDEFLVICPRTALEGALQLADKIGAAVSALRVPVGTGHWDGSVSIGVAARTADMENFEALIRLADRGAYLAKEAGRGCARSAA